MQCQKHPTYTAKRIPKENAEGLTCPECDYIYWLVRDPFLEETYPDMKIEVIDE